MYRRTMCDELYLPSLKALGCPVFCVFGYREADGLLAHAQDGPMTKPEHRHRREVVRAAVTSTAASLADWRGVELSRRRYVSVRCQPWKRWGAVSAT